MLIPPWLVKYPQTIWCQQTAAASSAVTVMYVVRLDDKEASAFDS